MKIEIITIGDEIMIGQLVDTNSHWMAGRLAEEGFELAAITTVGDNRQDILKAIDTAFGRAEVLLLTGGVGPTRDDVTKQTLADYYNSGMVFNQAVFDHICRLFAHKDLEMNELTRLQAYVPERATVIPNRAGTAPILWFEQNKRLLVSMPGVPFEMKTGMNEEIMPRLKKRFSATNYLRHTFLVSGISESALALMLEEFERCLPNSFSLAYLPSGGWIRLRLSARGMENGGEMEERKEQLRAALREFRVDEGEEEIERILGIALKNRGLTVSTAESCTGGEIAHRITAVAGASAYYKGSLVAYDNRVKSAILGVDPWLIEKFGAVSREVVESMANQVATMMETDCSIAVSGIAGPDGATSCKPVGTVWICTRVRSLVEAQEYHFGTMREENVNRAANTAIIQLLKMLNNS